MELSANVLYEFLHTSTSKRNFSFGNSAFYNGRSFEDLLYQDWVTMPIAHRFEERVLKWIRSAYSAISIFMNYSELLPYPSGRVQSPAFTENSDFNVNGILSGNLSPTHAMVTSPCQEDGLWALNLQDSLSHACHWPLPDSRMKIRPSANAKFSR